MRKLLFFIVPLLLLSCDEKPQGVLEPDKMVDLMVDMHLAEAVLHISPKQFSTKKDRLGVYYEVFQKHNITKAEMDSSLNYYMANAEEYRKIYDEVITRLQSIRVEAESGKFQDTREFVFDVLEEGIQILDSEERDSVVSEIWRMPRSFSLLEKGDKNTVEYTFLNDTSNQFTFLVLKGEFKLYLNDCSQSPVTRLKVLYDDETSEEVSTPLIKDAVLHPVRLRLPVDTAKNILRIEGALVGHDKCLSSKSVEISNVRLYKMKNPQKNTIESSIEMPELSN